MQWKALTYLLGEMQVVTVFWPGGVIKYKYSVELHISFLDHCVKYQWN